MTTLWIPAGEWKDATVAVLAGGPSLTAEAAESLREHRCISVNRACELAPWADMLVALDSNWPPLWREFPGMRVTGVEDESLDAFYIGHRFERVTLGPGSCIDIRNSGLTAVRIAAEMGASKIILAGFDVTEVDGFPYDGVAQGLAAIVAELQALGISAEKV